MFQTGFIDVQVLHVTSDVTFRFATTNMTSVVVNAGADAQETTFGIELPLQAFISEFHM